MLHGRLWQFGFEIRCWAWECRGCRGREEGALDVLSSSPGVPTSRKESDPESGGPIPRSEHHVGPLPRNGVSRDPRLSVDLIVARSPSPGTGASPAGRQMPASSRKSSPNAGAHRSNGARGREKFPRRAKISARLAHRDVQPRRCASEDEDEGMDVPGEEEEDDELRSCLDHIGNM
jgi:hypothetical protein